MSQPETWPVCPSCKSTDTVGREDYGDHVSGPVFAHCNACGHDWQCCGVLGVQAKRRGVRKRCAANIMANGRCHKHGGASTGPPLIHGRRSKHFPGRLAERISEALHDPELVSMLEDIALLDALIVEKASELGEIKQAELWSSAVDTFRGLKVVLRESCGDLDSEVTELVSAMDSILENGFGDASRLGAILSLTEQKRKLSDTEIKRQQALNQFVSTKELAVFMARLLDIINQTVQSPSERSRLGFQIARLAGG